MQAAQHALCRARVVVLHELGADAEFGESLAVVALEKEAARVAEHLGTQQQHLGMLGGDHLHQNTRSCSTSIR
jgi:hypothetical protein